MVSKADSKKLSPAMAQYHRWKAEYPDEILFFQMGDFFEMFHEDAKIVSKALGLTLTSRSKGADAVPMAGVPLKAVDQYLKKLVRMGYRVAICDQIEDPKEATGVVDRAVTRIVTAGTVTEDDLLDRGEPNYLASIHQDGKGRCGLALIDLSTGAFVVAESPVEEVVDALSRHRPAELLVAEAAKDSAPLDEIRRTLQVPITTQPDWQFERASALEAFQERYGVRSLDGFGLDPDSPLVEAGGAALRYLGDTQKTRLDHLDPPRLDSARDRLRLDRATRSCLELTETNRDGRKDGSLLAVLDQTVTALGARGLRAWLLAPLVDVAAIGRRQAAVAELIEDRALRSGLRAGLRAVADIERLLTRVVTNRANARDLVSLRLSLQAVPGARDRLDGALATDLDTLRQRLDPLEDLTDLLARALLDEPPMTIQEGGLIRDGYHAELDEVRAIHRDGRQFILGYQTEEIDRTGIQNLKVGYNRVFGFYIEITNSFRERVPTEYIRKQTLKNAERYITPRLKEFETRVLSAEENAKALELELFQEIRGAVTGRLDGLKSTATALAELDALLSLAEVAALHGYSRPEVDEGPALLIEEGRHPVLAESLGASVFVPNDCRLDRETARLAIVTGPNMAGKSTYIRQVALIQIMAQMGSFVPARRAVVGVADRVFARIGASDDLTRGNSTFMLEMTETANILNNATDRSLVILDEVGRGTSTFDGLALAWAISEHLLERTRCLAMFATHYHQLIDLAATYPAVQNLNVAVREWGEEIVFLHQIVEGGSDRSYGIHVARLAGVPQSVLVRAAELLRDLEENHPDLKPSQTGRAASSGTDATRIQETLFEPPERALLKELRSLDLDQTSPMSALQLLQRWREQYRS